MSPVATIDYLRLCRQLRRTISIDIPAALVARKGKSSVSRARCRRIEAELRETVRMEFRKAGRRPYRGEVALHLELHGVEMHRAARTVKAVVDAMKEPIYSDDRAVALLDVTVSPGPPSATIATCSVGEYADAFDILSGVRSYENEFDSNWDDLDQPNPWAWAPEISPSAEIDIEVTQENLAYAEAEPAAYPVDLRNNLIEFGRRRIREYELNAFLATPYLPIDRPGSPSLSGRLWNDSPHLGGPACFVIPAPSGGSGSWSEVVRAACLSHFETWGFSPSILATAPVAFDIAIGSDAAHFDVDNLARRVLQGLRVVVPDLPSPSSFRVYRRNGDDDMVVVRLHAARRANDLRWLMEGNGSALSGLRPDPNASSHRRRPTNDAIYENVRSEQLGINRDDQLLRSNQE